MVFGDNTGQFEWRGKH